MDYAPLKALFLNKSDIEAVAPFYGEIVDLMEETYRWHAEGKADVPVKIGVHPERPNAFLHAMPGDVSSVNALGAKVVTYFPGNYAQGLQDSTAIILLYDDRNGQPLAIMEGMWITFARTAASAAVAAKYFAPAKTEKLGLVGCGGLGTWSLLMLSEVFPSLTDVYVASRTSESRQSFCERMALDGRWRLHPVDEPQEAVTGMDIVVSSTPQQPAPRLRGEWWSPGTLAIPLDYPYAWDDDGLALADRLITDGLESIERAEARARASGRPGLKMPATRHEIFDVVAGRAPRRERDDERPLAIVTGIASTDLTLAMAIYRRAVDVGVGTPLALD